MSPGYVRGGQCGIIYILAMQLCTSAGELACGIPKDFTRDSLAIFPLGRAVPRTDSSTREVELELPKWKEGKFLAGHLEIPGAPGWVDAEMEHDGTERNRFWKFHDVPGV